MKLFIIALTVISIFASVANSFSQDFDYSKYKPRTLSELADLNPVPSEYASAKKFAIISGDLFSSQVRLKYIGTSRVISSEHREILTNWQKSFQIPAETVAMFQKEFLFKECDKEYWLPVQQQVTTFFPKELKEGDMVTLYLIFAGGMRTGGKTDYVFLANEFDK